MTGPTNSRLDMGRFEARFVDLKRTPNSRKTFLLVPDMKEVEKAYVEMTSGYKDFIRDVVKASRLRQEIQKDTSSKKDPSRGDL